MVLHGFAFHVVGRLGSCQWSCSSRSGAYASPRHTRLYSDTSDTGASLLSNTTPVRQPMATKVARQETCTQAEDVARPSVSADEASVVSQQPGGSRRFSGTDDPFDRMLQGSFQKAWSLFTSVDAHDHEPHSYATYQQLITCAVKAGEVYSGLQALRAIQTAGMQPNVVTYCGMISAFSRRRRHRERQLGYRLWQELQGGPLRLDAAAYRTGINACVTVGRLEEAQRAMDAMRKHSAPDLRAFNILIKGYSRAGDLAALQRTLQSIQNQGLRANAVTYATLVDAHVRAGELSRARQTLAAAAEDGVRVDAWSWTALIKGLADDGDMRAALEALQQMEQSGVRPSTVTWTTMVVGFSRSGSYQGARRMLEQMSAAGVPPSEQTYAYNSLLGAYARRGFAFRQATFDLLEEMSDAGIVESSTFNTLMNAAVECDDPEATLRLYGQMMEVGFPPDAITYTLLIKAHTMLDQVEEAIRAFEELDRDPHAVDSTALSVYINALARAGRMEAALRVLQRSDEAAIHAGEQPSVQAYGAIVAGFARQRDANAALDIFRHFIAAGGAPDKMMFDTLLSLCIKCEEYKSARQVAGTMRRSGAFQHERAYNQLLNELQRLEDRHSARLAGKVKQKRSEHLERLKYWLALPNSYYDDGNWS